MHIVTLLFVIYSFLIYLYLIIESGHVCYSTTWTVVQTKCIDVCSRYYKIKCKLGKLCSECVIERRQKLYAKIYYKLENSDVRELVLWTVGTNWRGNDKYRILQRCWTNFRRRLYHHMEGFKPVFRVTEEGYKGGYLHIHFLNNGGFMEYFEVRRHWSEVTGIREPNVEFSSQVGENSKAINYLMKYLEKGQEISSKNKERVDILRNTVKYSWLGEWYKIKFEKFDAPLCKHEFTYSFYTTIKEWDGLRIGKLNTYLINNE